MGLSAHFLEFADAAGTSPLYVRLARGVAEQPDVLALASEVRHPPAANVLFGAVHALLLAGDDHGLRAFYPSCGGCDPGDPVAAFVDFCITAADQLRPYLHTRITQTNEVGRCSVLLLGLLEIAGPVGLVEFGSSAGLHLFLDRYRYRWGDHELGWAESPVRLVTEVRGSCPQPRDLPALVYRVGLDRNPLDPGCVDDRLWLRALIWPEHQDRMAVLEAALSLAARGRPDVRAGDGISGLPAVLAEVPPGAERVLMHSHTWNQLTTAQRDRLEAILTDHAPAWRLAFEHVGGPVSELWLHRYEGGVESKKLCEADPHGRWIRWMS